MKIRIHSTEENLFFQALTLLEQVLDRLSQDVSNVVLQDSRLAPILAVFPVFVEKGKAKIDEVRAAAIEADEATMALLASVTDQEGLIPLAQMYLGLGNSDPSVLQEGPNQLSAKSLSETGGTVLETAGIIFDSLSSFTEAIPILSGILEAASELLEIISQFIQSEAGATAAEEQIEIKLEQLGDRVGRTITGEPIPVGPDTTFTPTRPPIKDELEKIETKLDKLADVLGRWLAGFPFLIEPEDPENPSPPEAIKPELEILQTALQTLASVLGNSLIGELGQFRGNDWGRLLKTPPTIAGENIPRSIKEEIEDIERKLDQPQPPPTPTPGAPGVGVGAGLSEDVEYIPARLQVVGNQLLYKYPVKFVCGEEIQPEGSVKPANYATAINIINLLGDSIQLSKRVVRARRQGEEPQPPSESITEILGPNECLEIDCADIRSLLAIPGTDFITGYIIIETLTPIRRGLIPRPLEVVAVYTALHKQELVIEPPVIPPE